jgi:hypothetical protein
MLHRFRTRRAIKAAEKNSGLKQENSIFRGKPAGKVAVQPQIVPNITAVLSEESETEGASSMYETNTHGIFDVDVSINTQELNQTAEMDMKENEVTQMKLAFEEFKIAHVEQLAKKDAIIQDTAKELDRTRQDFLEVIVDLSAKEQELSATKHRLIHTETELEQAKTELIATKEKLNALGSTVIQHQHMLHEAEEELHLRRQLFGFLYI